MDLVGRRAWLDERKLTWTTQHFGEVEGWLGWLKARQPKSILEIGAARGTNLFFMADAAAPGATLESVDISTTESTGWRLIEAQLAAEGYQAKIHGGVDSRQLLVAPLLRAEYDCVFIDGNHDYGIALQDWKQAMLLLAPGGCLAMHDTGSWPVTDRRYCSALWNDARRLLPAPVVGWRSKRGMGIGATAYRGRLLFMISGGLGDAAEMTRTLLVASRLGYIVHVLVLGGLAGELGSIWALIPWVTQVTREQAAKLHYQAILCPTSAEALRQRAVGLAYEQLSNGSSVSPVGGGIVETWQNLLISIGHLREEVRNLMPVSPLAYLLPPASRDLLAVAPGVGSALKHLEKGDKRYPNWAAAVRCLPRPLALIGNASAYEPWMDEFRGMAGVDNLIGSGKSLAELLPVLARTRLLLCPDNGIGHLAGLFGVPTLSIFNGVTDPRRYAPPEATVLLNKDGDLTADRLLDKVLSLPPAVAG